MAKFLCPFCMSEYDKDEVEYVCPDCGTVSKPKAFEKEPIKCQNKNCGRLATIRRCPKCNYDIPKMALETPSLPFSIVGVSNSGKTNYITVMLHELGRTSGLRLALGPQNKETMEHQNQNYRSIYEDHVMPGSTNAGEVLPQIWYIKNLQRKHGNSVPTYTFTIFDGAGEDHENQLVDTSSTVCRYINASKAVILTLDPLILSSVRRGGIVDPTVLRNSLGGYEGETKNATDIVNSVASYIKTARGLNVDKRLNIPVAVVLTKFDTVISHSSFSENALIKNPSLTTSNGKISQTEIKQIDSEIRGWLDAIGEGSFVNALEANFKKFTFFGVSSYGRPPKSDKELYEVKPHRVIDPILWLFKEAGFID